jgi:MT0933-like antitoxin protein
MGLLDKIRGMFGQHADKIEGGIDKTGDVIDDKTGGKYEAQVDKGQGAAKDTLGKLTGEDDGQQ